MRNELIIGLWNAICDRCGFKYKSNQLKKTWDNLMVCEDCWESRHPQDFVRARPDQQALPWTRPDSDTDSLGRPRVDVSPSINCDVLDFFPVPSHFMATQTIVKAMTLGPAVIDDGVTITVVCTLKVY